MSKFLVAGVATAAILGLAPAIAQTAQTGPQAQARHGAKVHSRAEVETKVARHFARMDADRDGFVTRAEADAAAQAMRARVQQRMGQRGQRGSMFDRLDTNRDGVVTRAEAEAVHQARAERQARHAGRIDALFTRFDTDRDGSISRVEFDAAHAQLKAQRRAGGARGGGMHRMSGRMFEMADADNDGRVSLQEAQAVALRHFDMADANRDGQVTPEERRQMRRQMKHERHPG